MSRIVALLRHGETEFHANNRYAGRTDVALNDTGLAQAAALADWGAVASLCAVWTSTLSRAIDTARPLAAAAGVQLTTDARLRELDFGSGEGLTAGQMREQFAAERAAFERDPFASPLPGGEHPAAAIERATAALRDALDAVETAPAEQLLVVVCHSTLLRLVVMHLTGQDPSGYRSALPAIQPAGGIVLNTDGHRADILAINPVFAPGMRFEGSSHGHVF